MSSPARTRPLSPHLGIYRWQMGNTLSILHRMTGVVLALGFPALAYWLIALAGGEASYGSAQRLFTSPVGRLWLIGWTFAFFYHLLNGIRHLGWDMGVGFERGPRWWSGWSVVGGAVAGTLALWAFVLLGGAS
jgi:succinate dehydrogenase / fumarate reductase cytochrome b subunit